MESDDEKIPPQSFNDMAKGNHKVDEQLSAGNKKTADYFPCSFEEMTMPDNDHYKELGDRYRLMSEEDKNQLIKDITNSMKGIGGPNREYMVNRQLCHWFRTDISLGITIAKGLDLDLSEMMKQMG